MWTRRISWIGPGRGVGTVSLIIVLTWAGTACAVIPTGNKPIAVADARKGNPLGDPMAVNWQSTDRHKFDKQTNRGQLTHALQVVVENREDWARDRPRLSAESTKRFNLSTFCRRHAHVLSAAAAGTSPALPPELV